MRCADWGLHFYTSTSSFFCCVLSGFNRYLLFNLWSYCKNKAKKEILEKGVEQAYYDSGVERNARLRGKRQMEQQKTSNEPSVNKKRQSTGQNIQNVLDNPVVGVAASYALGKAVSKPIKLKSQVYTCDPYHAGKNCAACEYWTGARTVEKRVAGAKNKVAICESKSVHGSCKKPGGRYLNRNRYCTDCCIDGWALWSALK